MRFCNIAVLLLPAAIAVTPVHAKGFFEKLVTNPIELIEDGVKSVSKVRIDVWNHTGSPIKTVMDNNREVRTIAPGGKATFGNANLGDMPTFHFYDTSSGHQLGSRKVKAPGNSTIEWRG